MRTDAKYSNRSVYCPNASTLGYGKYQAKRGDLIVYKEYYSDDDYRMRIARMLGTVDAPGFTFTHSNKTETQEPTKNALCVFALADDAHTAYERWVKPEDVIMIYNTPAKFAAFFFQEELPYDTVDIIRLSEYGTLSEHYIDKLDETSKRLGIKKKRNRKK